MTKCLGEERRLEFPRKKRSQLRETPESSFSPLPAPASLALPPSCKQVEVHRRARNGKALQTLNNTHPLQATEGERGTSGAKAGAAESPARGCGLPREPRCRGRGWSFASGFASRLRRGLAASPRWHSGIRHRSDSSCAQPISLAAGHRDRQADAVPPAPAARSPRSPSSGGYKTSPCSSRFARLLREKTCHGRFFQNFRLLAVERQRLPYACMTSLPLYKWKLLTFSCDAISLIRIGQSTWNWCG